MEEARLFLAAVARGLKPGARFVVETGMAAESILPSLTRTRWFRLGDILMLSENRYHPAESRLDIDYTFGVVRSRRGLPRATLSPQVRSRRRRWERGGGIVRVAASFLERLQFGASLGDRQRIDRNFSDLAMDL
jgi:hypothetical protein